MKVSLNWLKELVDYQLSSDELAEKLSLVSIGVKQQTEDYLELDLTYNRGDLLSLRGVAREVAAITGSKLKFEDQTLPEYDLPQVKVRLENEKLTPVYCVAKIETLKVEQSNDTWIKKLSESGLRSVNNIANVTNLIMLEYGQPMHAFDAKSVADEAIIVRCARQEENITTLDGVTYDLDTSDLLIADSLNVLGIAGVMGGKDSEVTNSTTTILLEAAIFDPVSIRKTSKRHGLHSEASRRFQHGLTKTNLLQAFTAAIKMYEDLGGKLTAVNLVGNMQENAKKVTLKHSGLNNLIGKEIPKQKVEEALDRLGFPASASNPGGWNVTVPYFRLDINIEEDLVEEIARMYGYEKIEGIPLSQQDDIPTLDQRLTDFIYDLKLKLKDLGLTEVNTYSFYSTAVLSALELITNHKNYLVKIANPISSETEYLRDSLWPNLVEVVGKNIRKGYRDIAIFEIGKVYSAANSQPEEKYRLSIALMNSSDNPIAELVALAQNLGSNLKGCKLNSSFFHPSRHKDGLAEVHLRILNKLGIEARVAIAEFEVKI